MDLLLLLAVFALFLIPSFLMMRKQRTHQAEMARMQAALAPGDYVVTGAGIHCRIVELGETTVDVELAPGTVVTMERIAVMRNVSADATGTGTDTETPDADDIASSETEVRGDDHPENFR